MMIKNLALLIFISFVACKENPTDKARVDRLPFYNEATFKANWIPESDLRLDTFHTISPFALTNQHGDLISEKTFKGKIYVTNFFFTTCPGICPKMTANMTLVQTEFLKDEDVLLLSHSVTPDIDSIAALNNYAKREGVVPGKWHLVTGPENEIYKLGRNEYFVEEDLGITKDDDEFLHTENFVLIDQNKHIRGIYNGLNKASVQQLIYDIKSLQKE